MKKRVRMLVLGVALLIPVVIFASSNGDGTGNEGERRFWGWETDCTGPINLPGGCFQQCVDHYYIFWTDVWQEEGYLVPC